MTVILATFRAAMLRAKRPTQAEPEILEIRVHGVQNTPPAEMLETTHENVERSLGDDLGSFWRRVDDTPAHGISTTEAFSWGAQARTGGGGAGAAVGRAVVHIGWFLLLPYALANLAYWTRRIRPQERARSKSWKGDSGAATVRIFGLLLTLIAVAAFCSVAIDLVAIQCFRENVKVCAPLPGVFDWLGQFDRDSRAALLGTLPIITILVLYVIGRSGRVRFEERVKDFAAGLGDTAKEPGRPLLATRGFWSVSRTGQTSEWLHVAASVDLVLLLLALDSAYVAVPDCFRTSSSMVTQDCIDAAWVYPLPAWFVIGALVLMTAIVVLVWLASHTPEEPGAGGRFVVRMSRSDAGSVEIRSAWKRGAAMTCLVLAISGYLAWTVLAFTKATADTIDGPGYLGLTATPIVLVVLALFLALAGTGWRAQPRSKSGPEARESRGWRWLSAVLLVLGVVALVLSHLEVFAAWRWVFVGGAAALVVAHLVISWSTSGNNKYEAWRGQGPAVVMLLALFASMALSSLLVLGAASWLGGPVDAAPADQARWNIPDAYERFAVLLTLIALLLLLLLLAVVAWNLRRFLWFSLPPLIGEGPDDDDGRSAEERGGIESADLDPETYAPRLRYPDGQVRRRVSVRRSSHMLHRGEPLFGWLAVFAAVGFFSLSSAAVFDLLKDTARSVSPELPANIRTVSTAVLVAIALAAVGAIVAHAASSSERPLGVFWDVVAFFPRAGHPLAPPCFGERVVPELAARTSRWLNDPMASRPRAVVFTAHSMGSTICAATLLAMRGEEIKAGPMKDMPGITDLVDHAALLSYGTQLRAYFSRFFPSVFGPAVLGVPGVLGPSLWFGDPWRNEVRAEFRSDHLPLPQQAKAQGDELTLTAILGAKGREVPRWCSLWRRTDFLGFPVYSYRDDDNPVDRGATESAPGSYLWRIATHSNYLGTRQFNVARDDLVKALGGRPG